MLVHVGLTVSVAVSASAENVKLANFNAFPTDGATMPPKAKHVHGGEVLEMVPYSLCFPPWFPS